MKCFYGAVALFAALSLSPCAPFEKPYACARNRDIVTWETFALLGSVSYNVDYVLVCQTFLHETGGDVRHDPIPCSNGTFDYGPGLNSRWLAWFSDKFNDGVPIDPCADSSAYFVAAILSWHLSVMPSEDMALTAYRWGQAGARARGIDSVYVAKVRGDM